MSRRFPISDVVVSWPAVSRVMPVLMISASDSDWPSSYSRHQANDIVPGLLAPLRCQPGQVLARLDQRLLGGEQNRLGGVAATPWKASRRSAHARKTGPCDAGTPSISVSTVTGTAEARSWMTSISPLLSTRSMSPSTICWILGRMASMTRGEKARSTSRRRRV